MAEKITKEMVNKAVKQKRSLWVQANRLDTAHEFKVECTKRGLNYRQALGQALSLWLAVVKKKT